MVIRSSKSRVGLASRSGLRGGAVTGLHGSSCLNKWRARPLDGGIRPRAPKPGGMAENAQRHEMDPNSTVPPGIATASRRHATHEQGRTARTDPG